MKRMLYLGLGIFFGMVATAFILRQEIRRLPERTEQGPALLRLRQMAETKAQRLARQRELLESEEQKQRPEEGRN